MASCGANAATATTSNMKRQNKHYATFCKRKQGLFNKLTELSLLCNVETALFIVSPNDKLYSCGYPNADYVLRRYLCAGKTPQRVNHARFLSKTDQEDATECETLRVEYEAAQSKLKEEKKRLEAMMESQSDWCFEAWWNLSTEGMSLEDLQMFRTSLENMKLNLLAAVQEKQLITSSLSQTSHPHFPNMSTFAPDYVQHSSNTAATTSPAVGYAAF